ncbi:MAG: lytic murein transglycosylase, partial [Pseudomonadota bacterium]
MRYLGALALSLLTAVPALAQSCGGSFNQFKANLAREATTLGIQAATADAFLRGVRQDPAVLKADRAQGVFQKPFIEFSRRLISQNRIDTGRAKARQFARVFDRVERDYGLDRHVLLAFWAFETDY